MQTQPLIDVLKKLLQLHQSLLQLSTEKTEAIKNNKISTLNDLIKNEQKHITAITILEKERKKVLTSLFPEKTEPNLSECLPHLGQHAQNEITIIQQELVNVLNELKAVNALNKELLDQSLQYINLNLDLLMPDELPNYSNGNDEAKKPQLSIFDSKA